MAEELTKKQKDEIVDQVKAEKKKQVRPNSSANRKLQMQPGENTKYNEHALEIMSLPKIDTKDANAIRERSLQYFQICAKNDMKPSVAGYSLSLGVGRKTLWEWMNRGADHRPPEVLEELQMFYNVLNMQMEDYMQNGKINPVSGIFLMKNNLGYKDQQDVVITPNRAEEVSPDTLIEESNLLNDDVID